MSQFVLSGCSTADLSAEHFAARDISIVSFHYMLGGKQYVDDLGKSMPFEAFYQAMVDGAETSTSQVNAEEYEQYFEKFLREGKDVLHVCLSSGISGTFNSARLAGEALREKYPERKLYVLDSLAAASGFGLLLDKLADLRDAGMSIDEVAAWCEEHKLEVSHWFFSSDLTFFIKGGRISKTSGMLGQLLNICPLMNVSHEGKLIVREKVRTKKKVIRAMVDKMEELAQDGLDYADKVYMCHSVCHEDARAVADLVEARFPNMKGKVEINWIGTTIGSHTGPGTVALFFWGKKREK